MTRSGAVSAMRRPAPSPDDARLLRHPSFDGFAPLLLPWDDRTYDERLPLAHIESLLPYHTHVDPATVVVGLNRIIDGAADARIVFCRFYTEAQAREAPARSKTVLFFFRGRPGAPFAVIAPGGGFSYVASVHEGFPDAVAISSKSYNAFVPKCLAGQGRGGGRGHGGGDLVHPDKRGLSGRWRHGLLAVGNSADARMAAAIGSHGVARFEGGSAPKTSAVVMAYTGYSDYAVAEPPRSSWSASGMASPRRQS